MYKVFRFPRACLHFLLQVFCLYFTWRHKSIYDIRTSESYALCAMLSLFLLLFILSSVASAMSIFDYDLIEKNVLCTYSQYHECPLSLFVVINFRLSNITKKEWDVLIIILQIHYFCQIILKFYSLLLHTIRLGFFFFNCVPTTYGST